MSADLIHFAAEARRRARAIISVPCLVSKTRDRRCFSSATFEGLIAALSLNSSALCIVFLFIVLKAAPGGVKKNSYCSSMYS